MTARRQLRLAIVAELQAIEGVTVASPGDWPSPQEKLPALLVNAPTEQKTALNKRLPEFNTVISISVQGQVTAATAEAAQDAIEDLAYQVENAVLLGYWVNAMIEQFVSVQTLTECKADGGRQLATFVMTFAAQTFESFDPTVAAPQASTWPPADPVIVPFEEVQMHLDTVSPFDASGTYANPPFPDAVQPAPRASGPDGRDEGALDIQLPQ